MNKQKTVHGAVLPDGLPRGRVAKKCHCGAWFDLPACHADRHHSCTATCAANKRRLEREERRQNCQVCGSTFIPRPNQLRDGGGKFCSKACSCEAGRQSEKRLPAFLAGVARRKAAGGYERKSGPENPQWTGGPEAARKRRITSGKAAAQLRKYRGANPEKTREWAQNRKYRRYGRLPRGLVKRLMGLQKGRCANCRACIRDKYHVDHIKPLARGGKHEEGNIQLLCPPCNLTKSDRDPIAFAQLQGRLI